MMNNMGRHGAEIAGKKEIPQEVKTSHYGCCNCLWCGVECKSGSMYKEQKINGKISCNTYTYYD